MSLFLDQSVLSQNRDLRTVSENGYESKKIVMLARTRMRHIKKFHFNRVSERLGLSLQSAIGPEVECCRSGFVHKLLLSDVTISP